MARTHGSKGKRTLDFVQAYDTLVNETGIDPIRVLFKLCKSRDKSIRRQAASDLLPYRYPKQAAIQVANVEQTEFAFAWDIEAENHSILPEPLQPQ